VSSAPRSAGSGKWASPGEGGEGDGWSPIEYSRHPHRHPRAHGARDPNRGRRAAAARARRRRLRLIDLAFALGLALVAIALAPGLAVVALLALVGLLACAASWAVGWARRRRAGDRGAAHGGR